MNRPEIEWIESTVSKWMKVDPATLKVGDEVRMVDAFSMFQISGKTSPSKIGICVGGIDFTEAPECRTWFVRKPKKAKPDSELADGHTAHYWRNKYNKQLDHSKQLEASNAGRRVKMQRLEKEAKDARRWVVEWESRYAVLAASINELPEEPTPPTRPDEPPVGSFFRVDRTGGKFLSIEPNGDYRYLVLDRATDDWPSDTRPWDEITEPGDTIKMLELREVEK